MKKFIVLILFFLFTITFCLENNEHIDSISEAINNIDGLKYYDENEIENLYTKEKFLDYKIAYKMLEYGNQKAFDYVLTEIQNNPKSLVLNKYFIYLSFYVDKEKYAEDSIEKIEKIIVNLTISSEELVFYNILRTAFYYILSDVKKAQQILNEVDLGINLLHNNVKKSFGVFKYNILDEINYFKKSNIMDEETYVGIRNKIINYMLRQEINIEKVLNYIEEKRQKYPDDYRFLNIIISSFNDEKYNKEKTKELISHFSEEIESLIGKEEHIGITKGELCLILLYFYKLNNDIDKMFEYYKIALEYEHEIIFRYWELFQYNIFKSNTIAKKLNQEFKENNIKPSSIIEEAIYYIERYYPSLYTKDIDWIKIKNSAFEKSKNINDLLSAYLIINEILISLQDGHFRLFPYENKKKFKNLTLRNKYYYEDISIKTIEDKPVIEYLSEKIKGKYNVDIGWQLLSINGLDPQEIVKKQRQLLFSYCSDEAWENIKYDNILKSIDKYYLEIQLKNPTNNNIKTIEIYKKSLYPPKQEDYKFKIIGRIGILTLNNFWFNVSDEEFQNIIYNELKKVDSLIIDLRNNKGGDLKNCWKIISYLLDKQIFSYYRCPYFESDSSLLALRVKPSMDVNYNFPVVLLTSGKCFSAAELFTAALKDSNRATVIGTTTSGGINPQRYLYLQDGSLLVISNTTYLRINGELIENIGIEPNIEVRQTYEDLVNGIDTQLQKAIDYLEDFKN